MKFMKIGTRPDTFFTVDATRSITLDVPSDLTIQVNNTKYLLHKFLLLPKCGLLQQLCDSNGSDVQTIDLHEVPAGEEGFELCVKFCYGISINLSATNIVKALCASHFLKMTEAVEKGNFISKLELFLASFILQAWKDPIVTLQSTVTLPTWSENLGMTGRCIDAVATKILADLSSVTWSYTYTRPGFNEKAHKRAPRDWWTEDIADLDVPLFQRVLSMVRSSIPAPLVGEALHVYACRHLPDEAAIESSSSESVVKQREVLEFIVSQIPTPKGSVSTGFLLRLLRQASRLGVSDWTMSEIMKRAGRQLKEASLVDLLKLRGSSPSSSAFSEINLVKTMLEHFLVDYRRPSLPETGMTEEENGKSDQSLVKVGKLIDSYLVEVAKDANLPVSKLIDLAETLPEEARPVHDDLYRIIDSYLKKHPDLSKSQKKRLCRMLDCRKLSIDACMHAVQNERLPLRTVVQVLFLEHVRAAMSISQNVELRHDIKAMLPQMSEDKHRKMLLAPECSDKVMTKQSDGRKLAERSISGESYSRDKRSPHGTVKPTIKEVMEVGKAMEVTEEIDSKGKIRPKGADRVSSRAVTSEIMEEADPKNKVKPMGMPPISHRTTKMGSKLPVQRGS
ncbi:BTB/POZ domain-containing protein [Nymphaea thermarum]|nr:BTB/POZ domain-containing protein [Nymphaea thermarum]